MYLRGASSGTHNGNFDFAQQRLLQAYEESHVKQVPAAVPPGPARRRPRAPWWPAIAWLFLLLPHFGFPLIGLYSPAPASVYLVYWAVLACCTPSVLRLRLTDQTGLRWRILLFIFYGLLSVFFGYGELSKTDHQTLSLTTGLVSYLVIAQQDLFHLVLAFLIFEFVRFSRISSIKLMQWWLIGMTIAVGFHVYSYFVSPDPMVRRAGVFTEGNLGGLYYVLSTFVAFEYRRFGMRRWGLVFAGLALVGILLSASTAAILVLAITLSTIYVMRARSALAKAWRTLLVIGTLVLIGASMYGTGTDFGIGEKLFDEDVTENSFSRIDRLTSIDIAIDLFLESPWFGHGLQSYGFLANDRLYGPLLETYDGSFRRIPNNIYVELAAETGIVGLLLFSRFMVALVRRIAVSPADKNKNVLGAVLAVLCYWLAFPTYSVLFVWAFFGLALAILRAFPAPMTKRPRATRRSARLRALVRPPTTTAKGGQ